MEFPYLSPPGQTSMRIALQDLLSLGAFHRDSTLSLTAHGQKMVQLPLDPHFAHLLLKSVEFHCVSEMLTVVSLLSSENVFVLPHTDDDKKKAGITHRNFASKDGDLPTLLNIYQGITRYIHMVSFLYRFSNSFAAYLLIWLCFN